MREAVLIEALRTPIGRRGGALSQLEPIRLSSLVLRALVERSGLDPELIDDLIWGCVTQQGEQGANIGRLAVLDAGFPVCVPAVTVNRMCGSSQQALHFACQAILAGDADIVIAGGVESMSRVPMGSDYPESFPTGFPYQLIHQGLSAELMAQRWQLSRAALDRFAYTSHCKAQAATVAGHFDRELVPIDTPTAHLARDEGIRADVDRERMAALPPAFQPDGVITAGNASQISDGAAALLLMERRRALQLGYLPRARVVARVAVGSDPLLMLSGPIPATQKALARAGLTTAEIDIFEVNEAFASVPLAWLQELQVPEERLNPQGGAIALGHPLGCTGARLMTSLLHGLERTGGRLGLQTMCIGHGQATATIIERLE